MPESTDSIEKKLNVKRIIIPVLLGISVAIYLLISSLNESKMVAVDLGMGDYIVDQQYLSTDEKLEDEAYQFVGEGKGDFKKESAKDNLQHIKDVLGKDG